MSSEIKDYLKKLDLTDVETNLYLSLLTIGPSSILELSRYTSIKRSTVHFSVENLIQKGFIEQTMVGKKRLVVAKDPSVIKSILNDRLQKMESLKGSVDKMIRSIKHLPKSETRNKLEVSYYEGIASIGEVYKNTLLADSVFSITNLDKYYKLYPGTRDLFVVALEQNKLRTIKTIAVDSYLSRQIDKKKSSDRYMCKFISEEFFDNVDIHIYDNNVAIIDLNIKKPTAIVIDSDIVSTAFRGIHNVLWSIL